MKEKIESMNESVFNEEKINRRIEELNWMEQGFNIARNEGKEYASFYAYSKSKQQPLDNKEWEIVTFESSLNNICKLRQNGKYSYDAQGYDGIWQLDVMMSQNNKIYSVKRLSDNSIWSIGDKIEGFGNYPIIEISRFKIDTFNKRRISAFNEYGYGMGHKTWKKPKHPLFTTADNVPIYEGDDFICVNSAWGMFDRYNASLDQYEDLKSHCKFFSTEAVAKQYVENNQPILSINDVKKHCHDDSAGGGILYLHIDKLIDLVKEKIK